MAIPLVTVMPFDNCEFSGNQKHRAGCIVGRFCVIMCCLVQVTWRSKQKGVVRYNCADSLDRTNAASYFAAVQVGQCLHIITP